ncbi:hypothetical protein ig2599ANME_2144 [groundwater metagenome]
MLVGFGLAGTYLIIRPLRSVTEGARALGEGKLEHRIDVTSEDESLIPLLRRSNVKRKPY